MSSPRAPSSGYRSTSFSARVSTLPQSYACGALTIRGLQLDTDSIHQLAPGLHERARSPLRAERRKPLARHTPDYDRAPVHVRRHHRSLGHPRFPVLPRGGGGRSEGPCAGPEVTRGDMWVYALFFVLILRTACVGWERVDSERFCIYICKRFPSLYELTLTRFC